jgi:hypothetical protein
MYGEFKTTTRIQPIFLSLCNPTLFLSYTVVNYSYLTRHVFRLCSTF